MQGAWEGGASVGLLWLARAREESMGLAQLRKGRLGLAGLYIFIFYLSFFFFSENS